MPIDIISSVSSILGGHAQTISSLIGEPEESTSAGMRAAVPALLVSMLRSGSDTRGANDLFRKLTDPGIDSGVAGSLGGLLSHQSGFDSILAGGQGLLGMLLGTRTQAVSQAVAQASGVKPSSASSLLALAAPVLFGFLKRQVLDGSLDANGFKSLLLGQRQGLQKWGLDPRITSALGVGNVQEVLGLPRRREEESTYAAARYGTETEGRSGGVGTRWLPWVLGLAAAAIALAFLWNVSTRSRDVSTRGLPGVSAAPGVSSVYFDAGETSLDSEDWRAIESAATTAREEGASVHVTGYAERSADSSQSLALAQQRAAAVRDGLIAKGVPEKSIVVSAPTFAQATDTRKQRVEIDLQR